MLESVRGFIGEILGYKAADPRKKEYGSLDDIRSRSQVRSDRNKLRRKKAIAGNGYSTNNRRYMRPQDNKRVSKMKGSANKTGPGRLARVMKSIKNVFSTEDQDLDLMQRACGNTNAMLPSAARRGTHHEERKRLRDRIVKSDAFKRKLLEIKYDDRMLEEIRRGRSVSRSGSGNRRIIGEESQDSQPLQDDKMVLLQKRLQELESKVQDMDKDLQISQKRLKFAQEKNALLESLLDDANIDGEYVKSRRDIKNLQRENLKPESELPPSPRRTVNPLFTSSPMRSKPSSSVQDNDNNEQNAHGPTQDFYSKYPKIPETELLVQERNRNSLSPIRIDYSKYST